MKASGMIHQGQVIAICLFQLNQHCMFEELSSFLILTASDHQTLIIDHDRLMVKRHGTLDRSISHAVPTSLKINDVLLILAKVPKVGNLQATTI